MIPDRRADQLEFPGGSGGRVGRSAGGTGGTREWARERGKLLAGAGGASRANQFLFGGIRDAEFRRYFRVKAWWTTSSDQTPGWVFGAMVMNRGYWNWGVSIRALRFSPVG